MSPALCCALDMYTHADMYKEIGISRDCLATQSPQSLSIAAVGTGAALSP